MLLMAMTTFGKLINKERMMINVRIEVTSKKEGGNCDLGKVLAMFGFSVGVMGAWVFTA